MDSATARLLADVAAQEFDGWPTPQRIVVLDDDRGLSDVLSERFADAELRVHSDRLSAERRLVERLGGRSGLQIVAGLGAELFDGAELVALDLPSSRSALDEVARLAAASGCPLLLGVGRDRHMTPTMNSTLEHSYAGVRASRGRQKSRVLMAREPRPASTPRVPGRRRLDDLELTVCAYGGVFAGTRIDAGTRLLLGTRARWRTAERIIDLGCGTGLLAASAARANPTAQVIAVDESAAAVRSAAATAEANGLTDRIRIERADGLTARPDRSAELILTNPPFHVGTEKQSEPTLQMLADAARVLDDGGELWTVQNSHLPYRRWLRTEVGPTEVIVQDRSYQVLRTTAPGPG